jgi:hypothetical protein
MVGRVLELRQFSLVGTYVAGNLRPKAKASSSLDYSDVNVALLEDAESGDPRCRRTL